MQRLFGQGLKTVIAQTGVVAVLVIDREDDALPLAEALLSGGIKVMELTLRTPAAVPAFKRIKREVVEMTVGIGTVLTRDQVSLCVDEGADFAVSPGLNPDTLSYALERGLPFAPGVMTPSDIEAGLAQGCRWLKYFPAESAGGVKHLGDMLAPYQHLGLSFIPLGGLTADNMQNYFALPSVVAIGGSWIAKREAILAGDWKGIGARAREAVEWAAQCLKNRK